MLPEEVLEQLGDRGAALFQAFEQDLIADIARRIRKTGRYTETAELQAQAMMAEGVSPAEIQKEVMKILRADDDYQKAVAQNTLEWKNQVKSEISEMRRQAKEEGDDIIANAGDMSFNYDLSMWEQNGDKLKKDSAINRMVSEMSKDTVGTFKNLTRSMGFKGPYDFVTLQNAYIRYLDKAVVKMASGTFSFDRAVEDAVREMAHSGLRSVDYASGRTYQLDTAARMCVRTSCHQLSAKMSMHNCEKMGTDLVEVTAHWGARPEHALWQGKVYSRSGKNKNYPPFSECHYGAADGLCGVNCRHTFYPFFDGISEPTKWDDEPKPKEYNGKIYTYYDATQKQRQMEKKIRETKKEIEGRKTIGADTSILEAKKRKQIAEYHNFSREMGIRAKDNRLIVIRGSSELAKLKKNSTMIREYNPYRNVFLKGKADNKEHLSICTTDNIEVMSIDGGDYEVQLTDEAINLLESSPERSLNIFHNHPSCSSFSVDDILTQNRFPAIKESGISDAGGTRYMMDMNGKHVTEDDITREYNSLIYKYYNTFAEKINAGQMTIEEANRQHSILISEEISKKFKWTFRKEDVDEKGKDRV